jgi:hypothetical protein
MKLLSVFLTECKIGGIVKRRENHLFKRLSKFKAFALGGSAL